MKNRNRYRLTEEHKVFVCQGVAEFKPWREIADQFLERFAAFVEGKENVERWLMGRIEYYTSHRDAEKWQDLIQEMREHWRKGILEEPLANMRERVRLLARDVNRIEKRLETAGDLPGERKAQVVFTRAFTDLISEQAKLLDQIADEVGDKVARNQEDVRVSGAAPIQIVRLHMPDFVKQGEEQAALASLEQRAGQSGLVEDKEEVKNLVAGRTRQGGVRPAFIDGR